MIIVLSVFVEVMFVVQLAITTMDSLLLGSQQQGLIHFHRESTAFYVDNREGLICDHNLRESKGLYKNGRPYNFQGPLL